MSKSSKCRTAPTGRLRHSAYRVARASAFAARSGNGNAGTGASDDGTPRTLMNVASSVFPFACSAASRIAAATSSRVLGDDRDVDRDDGVDVRIVEQQPQRAAVVIRATPRRSCRPDCRRSPRAGAYARRLSSVASASCAISSPRASQASAARMPGPPAFVTIATRRPRGSG